MGNWQYKVRKGYVILNPFLKRKARVQRIQWIMRSAPLINHGVPFFFEPWVNPDDFYDWEEQDINPTTREVLSRFAKEFWRWVKRTITGIYVSDNGTVWRWNSKTETYLKDS